MKPGDKVVTNVPLAPVPHHPGVIKELLCNNYWIVFTDENKTSWCPFSEQQLILANDFTELEYLIYGVT